MDFMTVLQNCAIEDIKDNFFSIIYLQKNVLMSVSHHRTTIFFSKNVLQNILCCVPQRLK